MKIKRRLYDPITSHLFKGKAIVLTGARQVGKTNLFQYIESSLGIPVERLNCDDPVSRALLANPTLSHLRLMLNGKRGLIIDEAQRVENIGLTLKMIADNLPSKEKFLVKITGK